MFRLSAFSGTNQGKMDEVGYGKPPKDRQFKPGQSGNPKGKPKKLPAIDDLLVEVLGDSENSEVAKAIVEALAKKARKGDVRAIEVLMDRGWGKPKQSVQVESEITVTVKHES